MDILQIIVNRGYRITIEPPDYDDDYRVELFDAENDTYLDGGYGKTVAEALTTAVSVLLPKLNAESEGEAD